MKYVALALIALVAVGCGEKVDLTKEKSPDATAPAKSPPVSTKPFKGGFQTQKIGS